MPKLKSPVLIGLESKEVEFRDNDPEHYPIPALRKSGAVLMRLEFDQVDREMIATGYDLFVEVLTNGGLQPMRYVVGEKFLDARDWEREGY